MGKRPDGKIASDWKSYQIFHMLCDLDGMLPKGQSQIWTVDFRPCASEDGEFIVREGTHDSMACPICTEGKPCFQNSPIWGFSGIKQGIRGAMKTKMHFRLIAKSCVSVHRSGEWYMVEQIATPGEHFFLSERTTLFERAVFKKGERIISASHFKNKCLSCPSQDFHSKIIEGTRDHVRLLRCKGCWIQFYLAKCKLLEHHEVSGKCADCNSCDIIQNPRLILGLTYVECRSCGQNGIVLPVDHNDVFRSLVPDEHRQLLVDMFDEMRKEELRDESLTKN